MFFSLSLLQRSAINKRRGNKKKSGQPSHSQGLLGLAHGRQSHERRLQRLLVRVDHGKLVLVQGRRREGQEVHVAAGSTQNQRSRVGPILQASLVRHIPFGEQEHLQGVQDARVVVRQSGRRGQLESVVLESGRLSGEG